MFVRCGDDAHVDAQGFVGAHALEALFLKHAQNFRLRAQAHVADFIEKERTAVGFLKFADFVFCRTGKAALDVAEELRFDQLLGNRGAINFHERAFAAKARGMQGARNKFLARAAFTIDKDAAVGRRGDGDLLAQRLHGNAIADYLVAVAQFAAQQLVLLFQAALLNGVADENNDPFERERLLDKIEGPEFSSANRCLDRAVS